MSEPASKLTASKRPLPKLALPKLALALTVLLPVLAILGCGSAAHSQRATKGAETTKAQGAGAGIVHGVDMFPPPPPVGEQMTVARVERTPITSATFVHWAEILTPKIASYEPKSRADCSSVRASSEVRGSKQELAKLSPAQIQALCVSQKQGEVKDTVLQQLISAQWQIGEAAELGVGVSQAQAEQRVAKDAAQQFKSRAELQAYLAKTGRTLADLTFEIRAQMAAENILGVVRQRAARKLDEAAIARYYHAHKSEFQVPETRDIRGVRTWTHSAIAKAMAEVRRGRSIAQVASRVSIDKPSDEHGGLIAGIAPGQEEKGLDEAIFAAKLHTLVGPLHLRRRYWAFEVVKITPGQIKPYKQIEAQVREVLSQKLFEEERKAFVRAFRSRWLARTDCRYGFVISRCREWTGPSVLSTEPYEVR
jgi:foldase protein PrsA